MLPDSSNKTKQPTTQQPKASLHVDLPKLTLSFCPNIKPAQMETLFTIWQLVLTLFSFPRLARSCQREMSAWRDAEVQGHGFILRMCTGLDSDKELSRPGKGNVLINTGIWQGPHSVSWFRQLLFIYSIQWDQVIEVPIAGNCLRNCIPWPHN